MLSQTPRVGDWHPNRKHELALGLSPVILVIQRLLSAKVIVAKKNEKNTKKTLA